MSSITGTATDYNDFVAKLDAFLTTDAALVAAGQAWTLVWTSADTTQKIFKGPGLDGTAAVYVGRMLVTVPASDSYVLQLRGFQDVVPGVATWDEHVNPQPYGAAIYLDSNPMQYWISGNGRRFAMVVKISTVYESAYCGLILPYALPTNWPYPLVVVGTRGAQTIDVAPGGISTWRDGTGWHSGLMAPTEDLAGNGAARNNPSGMLLDPSGLWVSLTVSGPQLNSRHVTVFPIYPGQAQWGDIGFAGWNNSSDGLGQYAMWSIIRPGFDGSYPLIPLHLCTSTPNGLPPFENELWGVFDGLSWVPGSGNGSENTVTVDGVTHLVVQNCFRTTNTDYFTMALE